MTSSLAHRGPDGVGLWYDASSGLGLGHQRLSIRDLSDQGSQPMWSSNRRWVATYNGELYNAEALADELSAEHKLRLRGRSDTEILIEAFAHWGVKESLPKFIGMFAFAAFDTACKKLYLCRDRLGIKPLYYGRIDSGLVFASELRAFTALPSFSPSVDRGALAGYLRYGVVPGSRSIYAGIHHLRPAMCAEIDSAGHEYVWPYWSLLEQGAAVLGSRSTQSFEQTVSELHELLRTSVRDRLVSDVPLGAFLSGGVDSSLVVALMRSVSSASVKTFSIGFEDKAYDESAAARAVANVLDTDHTELIVSPETVREQIPRLAAVFDEPFADSSQLPTLLVSQLARKDVTVVLSGDGGDELFGGYNRHLWAPRLWSRTATVPQALRELAARCVQRISPQTWDQAYSFLRPVLPRLFRARLPGDKLHKFARLLQAASSAAAYQALCSQWQSPLQIVRLCESEASPWTTQCPAALSFAERMMLLDLLNYLPDDILTKVDRATMSVGLEARVPLLDHRVVEYAWSLPLNHRIRAGTGKAVLREILGRYVPRSLFDRPKMGFGIPLGAWLRGPLRDWAEDLLSLGRLSQGGWFDPVPIRNLWHDHLTGRVNGEHALWPILMFESWLDKPHPV